MSMPELPIPQIPFLAPLFRGKADFVERFEQKGRYLMKILMICAIVLCIINTIAFLCTEYAFVSLIWIIDAISLIYALKTGQENYIVTIIVLIVGIPALIKLLSEADFSPRNLFILVIAALTLLFCALGLFLAKILSANVINELNEFKNQYTVSEETDAQTDDLKISSQLQK